MDALPFLLLWRRFSDKRPAAFCQRPDGAPLPKPFAKPPGEGLSSSTVNMLWGFFNLAIGYVLICRVGNFDLRSADHAVGLGLGVLVIGVMLARAFSRFHGGNSPGVS
jgi:hypothetical protein